MRDKIAKLREQADALEKSRMWRMSLDESSARDTQGERDRLVVEVLSALWDRLESLEAAVCGNMSDRGAPTTHGEGSAPGEATEVSTRGQGREP